MCSAITEIDKFLGMANEVRAVEGTSLVPHIRSRRGVAARQRVTMSP